MAPCFQTEAAWVAHARSAKAFPALLEDPRVVKLQHDPPKRNVIRMASLTYPWYGNDYDRTNGILLFPDQTCLVKQGCHVYSTVYIIQEPCHTCARPTRSNIGNLLIELLEQLIVGPCQMK